jgi:hypothetical protein
MRRDGRKGPEGKKVVEEAKWIVKVPIGKVEFFSPARLGRRAMPCPRRVPWFLYLTRRENRTTKSGTCYTQFPPTLHHESMTVSWTGTARLNTHHAHTCPPGGLLEFGLSRFRRKCHHLHFSHCPLAFLSIMQARQPGQVPLGACGSVNIEAWRATHEAPSSSRASLAPDFNATTALSHSPHIPTTSLSVYHRQKTKNPRHRAT